MVRDACGAYPPKLCLQAPPVNRPLKSMTKTLPQSGYLSLISVSMVALSFRACAVVTNNWSLFGPPKVHAVTEKAVGKYSSKVTEVPVGSKRRILEPRHLRRNQYKRQKATKPCEAGARSACIYTDRALQMQPSLSMQNPSQKLLAGKLRAFPSMNSRRLETAPLSRS